MRTLAPGFGKLAAMGTASEPVVIAEQGGLVVAERGPEILVIDRGNGPAEITAFVLLILTVVFGGFGLVSVTSAAVGGMTPQSGVIGAVILAVGVVAGVGTVVLVRSIRRRRRRPLTSFTPVAVFDRSQQLYRGPAGEVLAPLHQVRFERRLQMTSSSPKLVAVTPAGVHVLKRGNPFGGGVGTLDQVLTQAVHGGLPPQHRPER